MLLQTAPLYANIPIMHLLEAYAQQFDLVIPLSISRTEELDRIGKIAQEHFVSVHQ